MNSKLLEMFFADEHTRETFKEFQLKVLEEMIIKDVFETGGEQSKAHQQTKKLIEQSYIRLEDIFGTVAKPTTDDPR